MKPLGVASAASRTAPPAANPVTSTSTAMPSRLAAPVAVLLAALLPALAPTPARAAGCDLAIQHAARVVAYGERAATTQNMLEATTAANDARYPAIDAAQAAKACGCPEVQPLLAEAAEAANRANAAFNLTAAQQYGMTIRKNGQAAIDALRRCSQR